MFPRDSAADAGEATPEAASAPAAVEPDPGAASPFAGARPGGNPDLEGRVVEVLKTCFDPEIPVNIYELGLIYELLTTPEGAVHVRMTLTSPMCPVAGSLPPEVDGKIRAVPGVKDVRVDLVWDPPWDPSRMSEAARLQLNMF
jgi:FeS assembly SUF system protein